MIELIEPFPESDYPLLWGWLNEIRENNFDDSGIKFFSDFAEDMKRRYAAGYRAIEVVHSGKPIGVIGYEQISIDVGMFRGICFTQFFHGTGIPLTAVSQFIEAVFDGNTKEIHVQYPQSNGRVRNFLQKLGFLELLHVSPSNNTRNGQPILWTGALLSENAFLRSNRGFGAHQERVHESKDLSSHHG